MADYVRGTLQIKEVRSIVVNRSFSHSSSGRSLSLFKIKTKIHSFFMRMSLENISDEEINRMDWVEARSHVIYIQWGNIALWMFHGLCAFFILVLGILPMLFGGPNHYPWPWDITFLWVVYGAGSSVIMLNSRSLIKKLNKRMSDIRNLTNTQSRTT